MAVPVMLSGCTISRCTPSSAYRAAVSRSSPLGGVMLISRSPSPAGRGWRSAACRRPVSASAVWCGQVSQPNQRLDPEVVGRLGVRGQRDVIADPERLEPGLLGQPGPPGHHLRLDAAPPAQPVDGKPHPLDHLSR